MNFKKTLTMKKFFFTLGLFSAGFMAYGQIGVNNSSPQSTFDITAKVTDGSKAEGLIAPRLTGDQIKLGDARYGANQKGALIYATAAVTAASTKTANITAEGYYSFDGTLWQKITTGDIRNLYNTNDKLTANRIANLDGKTLSFSNTTGTGIVNQFSVGGNVLSADLAKSRIGVGTSAPAGALDITSKTGALIPPRMNSTERNNLVLGSRPSGSVIYNSDVSRLQVNVGTDASPLWSNVDVSSSTLNTIFVRSANAVQIKSPNQNITFSNLLFDNTSGFVSYDTTTNRFLLKAGKTYQLEFSVNWLQGTTALTYARFKWRNVTTNTFIGVAQHLEYATSDFPVGGGGNAFAYISPTADTQVDVVFTNGQNNIEIGDSTNGGSFPSVKITILN